jgi:hypothetical protein
VKLAALDALRHPPFKLRLLNFDAHGFPSLRAIPARHPAESDETAPSDESWNESPAPEQDLNAQQPTEPLVTKFHR